MSEQTEVPRTCGECGYVAATQFLVNWNVNERAASCLHPEREKQTVVSSQPPPSWCPLRGEVALAEPAAKDANPTLHVQADARGRVRGLSVVDGNGYSIDLSRIVHRATATLSGSNHALTTVEFIGARIEVEE